MEKNYFAIVIGAGSGGLVVAVGLAKAKKRVLLIEAENYGGDCTNFGCIPSKSLIQAAEVAHTLLEREKFGIQCAVSDFSSDNAFTYVQKKVASILEEETPDALEKKGVETVTGHATFLSNDEVVVNNVTYKATHIIIATGSKPDIPIIDGLHTVSYHTNETIFSFKKCPKSLAIIGTGPIGCELGQAFRRLGAKVTLIGKHPELMMREEPEVRKVITEQFEKEGISLLLGTIPKRVYEQNDQIVVETEHGQVEVESLLVATGRKPNIERLGLENSAVCYSEKGIKQNRYGQTTVSSVWVVGDAAGAPFFTHWAEHQARVVLFNLLVPSLFWKKIAPLHNLSHTTFTVPEVSRVGKLANECGECDVVYFDFANLDRARTSSTENGFLKVIVKKGSGKILGATCVGPRASEIVSELSVAKNAKQSLKKVQEVIHPYPSYALAARKAADIWVLQHYLPYLLRLPKALLKRFWPLFILLIAGLIFYYSEIYTYFNFDFLRENRNAIKAFVHDNPIKAALAYMATYIVITALEVPFAIFLSLTGGFLFAQPWCTIYTVVGATVGATAIFFAAKTLFGDLLQKQAGPFLRKMEQGFKEDAISYMLFLRLVPIFPFWLVNIAPAFFNISIYHFALTTFFGIIPGAFVFTQAGRALDSLLAQEKIITAQDVLTTEIIVLFCGLGILALIGPLAKKWWGKKQKNNTLDK